MRNILITGGAGFIGSNFVRHALQNESDWYLVNLDVLTYAGSLENLMDLPDPTRHTFLRGDICDQDLVVGVLREYGIDTIVHFAAETHVDRSITGPAPFIRTNLSGTYTLLEAARQVWAVNGGYHDKRFHHISTDEVFGALESGAAPFLETTPYDPRSPYSASKAGSDHLARAYYYTYGLPVTLTNCSNNYGPYQFPEKLIPLSILNGLRGQPIPIYGDGRQVRDWLYVEDHCEAIRLVLSRGIPGESYNIGGQNQPHNLEIVQQLCTLLDELHPAGRPHHTLVTHVADRPGHDRRYAMDITKIQSELGWSPQHNLSSGLRSTVEWYLSHPKWVEFVTNPDRLRTSPGINPNPQGDSA